MKTKTHWLQSPNKNYLGHWDLPDKKDLTLTIHSAKWEEVKNPITGKSEAKRVVRFKQPNIKPLICNQTNAQAIIKSTGVKFMDDSEGSIIQLYVGSIVDTRTKERVDCVRIRTEPVMSEDEILKYITNTFKTTGSVLPDADKLAIQRVIDNKETLSYQKAYNYLKSRENGNK